MYRQRQGEGKGMGLVEAFGAGVHPSARRWPPHPRRLLDGRTLLKCEISARASEAAREAPWGEDNDGSAGARGAGFDLLADDVLD